MNTRCGVPTDTPASRPCASMMLPLRSFDWLMIGDDAARPRCVAASKQTVSNAPRMIAAVTGSTVAEVARGSRPAASCLFNSTDIAAPLCPALGRAQCRERGGRVGEDQVWAGTVKQ